MGETLTTRRGGENASADALCLDVTVLMGGPGSEREVSLMSGRAVAEALTRCGHRVTTADIDPDDLSALDRRGAQVVFIALHGDFGEDGQVQRLCERRRLPYVGSGPEASGLAMDKDASKRLFRRAGLATPRWVVVEGACPPAQRRRRLAAVPPPCVLKPVCGGSSVDVTIARDGRARDAALAGLLDKYGKALVEAYVPGREMTVGILAGRALPVVEVRHRREFYDYVAKYADDGTQYLVDVDLPAQMTRRLQDDALRAHAALGCRDFSRVDFILAGDGTPQVLEVNTIPGFTSHSLLPKAAAAAGISFEELCRRLVLLAWARR